MVAGIGRVRDAWGSLTSAGARKIPSRHIVLDTRSLPRPVEYFFVTTSSSLNIDMSGFTQARSYTHHPSALLPDSSAARHCSFISLVSALAGMHVFECQRLLCRWRADSQHPDIPKPTT